MEENNKPVATGFDSEDIEKNKVMAVLAYLGILFLIPLFAAKESKFARFHTNQGFILFIASFIIWLITCIMSWFKIFQIAVVIFVILGIINAVKGEAKELPFIGKFQILK